MGMNRFGFLALLIATASIALAACGGADSPDRSGNSEADFREAALKHARCMRQHGIDMPDPTFGGGTNKDEIELQRPAGGKQAFQRAEDACRKYLDAVRGPELSPEQEREFRENALRHARCMREHGIDLPDPTFSEGRVQMRLPNGLRPENPRFQEAASKCLEYDPKARLRRAGQ
jgi:hypothetical protein